MGIEPTCTAWKAEVLPLNYARLGWVLDGGRHRVGVASTNSDHHSVSHDLTSYWRDLSCAGVEEVVGRAGFEPAKALPSDLQSDPFGRSGTSPRGQGPIRTPTRS